MPDNQDARRDLFVVSFAALFLEMATIRWLNASLTVVAYFANIILISCFFGLGVGCLLAGRKKSLLPWYPFVFLGFVLAVTYLNRHGIEISYTDDVVYVADREFYERGVLAVSAAVLIGFVINTALFVIIGQALGARLEAVGDPLRAYAYDIGGSFCGTVAYVLLARLETPPHVWFAVGILLLVFLVRRNRAVAAAGLVAAAIALALLSRTYPGARWSPYYRVDVKEYANAENKTLGHMILVNNLRIQDALAFGPALARSGLASWIGYYDLPYRFCRPRKVLILGAGSGNEAWFAARHGAEEIHAVEIDPVIADLGRTLHANRPYTLPHVTVFVNDARAFLAGTQERYDLIVMSALDSHRQIPGMSSLRLESFVYTVESFRRIRALLAPGGVFCLNLGSTRPWMGERTYQSLADAFGEPPALFQSEGSPFGSVAYLFGPKDALARDLDPAGAPMARLDPPPRRDGVRDCTDDWPYLYLETNRIPKACLTVLVAIVALSVLGVAAAERSMRKPDLHFFLLGAGFMLLETRSISQMALAFGATWSVNAVVVAAVLATIFLANGLVRSENAPSRRTSYAALFLTLGIAYLFPFGVLLSFRIPLRLLLAAAVVGLPILWASLIFSDSFRRESRPAAAFGSNLLGVVVGGALEYTSNVWGLNALYLLAAALYLASAWFVIGKRGRPLAAR